MAVEHIGKLSPNAVLADALSEVDEIEYVVLYIANKNGGGSFVSWSICELRDVAFAIQTIQGEFHKELNEANLGSME